MRVNLDKNLDKDVSQTIKTEIGNPPKLPRNKVRYVNFCKLTQITKTVIISGQVVLLFDIELK